MFPSLYQLCQRLGEQVAEALLLASHSSDLRALDSLPEILDDAWMFGASVDLVSRPSSPMSHPSSSSASSPVQQTKSLKPWAKPTAGPGAPASRAPSVWAGDGKPRVRRGGPSLCYVPANAARACPCSANGWEDEWVTSGVSSSLDTPQPALLRAGANVLRPEPGTAASIEGAAASAWAAPDAAPAASPDAVAAADPLLGRRAPALKKLKVPVREKSGAPHSAASKVQVIMCQTYDEATTEKAVLPAFSSLPLKCH